MLHQEGWYFQDYVIWFLSHAKTAKKYFFLDLIFVYIDIWQL
jgi:hypothetical protein